MHEGVSTLAALDWRPAINSSLIVLSRDNGNEIARVSMGNRYCLHTINCFDDAQQLTIDVIELDRPVYDQYELKSMFHDDVSRFTDSLSHRY